MKLSIIVPVYNEEKTVENLLKKLNKIDISPVLKEIIVVNDKSSDKTPEILQRLKSAHKELKIFHHKQNLGKGSALKTGFKHAAGDYIVIQDADLEYNPEDLVKLLAPILKGNATVVYGTRLKRLPHLNKEESTMRFVIHYFGNRFLSLMTSILYGQWITDMETCYKIFPKSALQKFQLEGKGFDFEPEITAKLMKHGYKIMEMPITVIPRGYEEGKKLQTIPEGLRALWTLVKFRFTQ